MPGKRGRAELEADATEFSRVFRMAKEFDKELVKRIRRNIREAAKPAVAEVKREVQKTPRSGGKRSAKVRVVRRGQERTTNLRAALAAGTSLRITARARGGTVTITTDARRLPPDRAPMVRAYNKRSFRHPVFGDTERWVAQKGTPYFGPVILRHEKSLHAAVEAALAEAIAEATRKR
jgi:hypothetical protein